MDITVSGKQVDLSDALHEQVWQHLDAIGARYAHEQFAAQVTFSRERRFFICEIGLQTTRMRLRSEAGAADAYQAFNKALVPIAERLAEARSRRYHRRTEPTAETTLRTLLRNDGEE